MREPEAEFVPPGPARMGYQYWAAYNFHANFNKAFYYRDTPERLFMPSFETDSETDFAIDYMNSRASKPFFLTVAPHPPHPPWRPEQIPAGTLAAHAQGSLLASERQGAARTPTWSTRAATTPCWAMPTKISAAC